jgi:phytoene dehydrogenase-like protein
MKKIIIIGAGMAGLSAGVHAQLKGCQSVIFESHFLPGGLCTAWKRKSYLFEGCLHFIGLFGLSPRHQFYRLWRDLGIFPETRTHRFELCHEYRDARGRRLRWFADASRLEAELVALSPEDAPEIRRLCRSARLASGFLRTAGNPMLAVARLLAIARLVPTLKRCGGLTVGEYASRFQDPLIRRAVSGFFIHPEAPANSLFIFMGTFHLGEAGYPLGSSLAMAQKVAARYQALGGELRYRCRVDRILVEDGRAVGVRLTDGSEERADAVVSAADLRTTCVDFLENRFTPPAIRERLAAPKLFQPLIQVSLGVDMDLSGWPHSVQAETPEPFTVAGVERQAIWFQHFAFDPASAPAGKTAVIVLFPSRWDWWERLGRGCEAYAAEKEAVLRATVGQLDRLIPGLAGKVEVSDVSTPLTAQRYTGNWQGALGFMMTPELAGEMMMAPQYTFEGLEAFYQAGQWVRGLGIPMAAMSGKEVVRLIGRAKSPGNGRS